MIDADFFAVMMNSPYLYGEFRIPSPNTKEINH